MILTESLSATEERKLRVSEIFSSVQGEGPSLGTPAVFLRLAICNLHCWYCDTKYTWLYNSKALERVQSEIKRLGVEQPPADLKVYNVDEEAKEMTLNQVFDEVSRSNLHRMVLTGGEPMLQQKALVPLLRALKERADFLVEVETSGTIMPQHDMISLVDQWNVSPKIESSGNPLNAREKSSVLSLFSRLPNAYFKFVVQSAIDMNEIEILSNRYHLEHSRVFLMPEGTEPGVLKERSGWLSTACHDKSYRFTTRLHIFLYGNKRAT